MRTRYVCAMTLSAALLAGGAMIAFAQPVSACGLDTVALTGNTKVAEAIQTVPTPRVRDQKKPAPNGSGTVGAIGTGAAGNGAGANGGGSSTGGGSH